MENTDTQHLDKLKAYWDANQAFPSMAKLRAVVAMTSTASVFEMIGRLVDAGYLERIEGRVAPTAKFFARPLFKFQGSSVTVTAEQPTLAMPNPLKSFFLQVPDDKRLADLALKAGDTLVMQQDLPMAVGDLVLVNQDRRLQFGRVTDCARLKVLFDVVVTTDELSEPSEYPQGVLGVAIQLVRRFDRRV
jgi:repressor LexA